MPTLSLHEAEIVYRKILEIDPNNADAYCNFGDLLFRQQRLEEAKGNFEAAINLRPNFGLAHRNLGVVYQAQGKLEAAATCYKSSLSLLPDDCETFLYYAGCHKIANHDHELVAQFEAIANKSIHDHPLNSSVFFALGKCYDDMGLYEKAFSHYRTANEIEGCKHQFDRKLHEDFISKIIQFFPKKTFTKHDTSLQTDRTPIFIVGMPRSGTTLLNQIISNHPSVESVGESLFWGEITPSPPDVIKLDSAIFLPLATHYLEHLRSYHPTAEHIVDKMPQNFLHLGLIHLCFPSARIIHCKRNSLDTCLSVYFQRFTDSHPYAYDIEDIALYYAQYERLMAHWLAALPTHSLFEISYEDMIFNQETTTKKILDFCNLEWSDGCLHYQKNERPVLSASNWSVRQALFSSSISRWKNYAPFLPNSILNQLCQK